MASVTRTHWPALPAALKRRPSTNLPSSYRGMALEVSGHDLQQPLSGPAPLVSANSVPAALNALPDHAMLKIIAACSARQAAVPELKAVRGLDGLCKAVQQQLCRLRPIVRVRVGSLGVAQRLSWLYKRQMVGDLVFVREVRWTIPPAADGNTREADGWAACLFSSTSLIPVTWRPLAAGDPWRIVVWYTGELKTAVVAQVLWSSLALACLPPPSLSFTHTLPPLPPFPSAPTPLSCTPSLSLWFSLCYCCRRPGEASGRALDRRPTQRHACP